MITNGKVTIYHYSNGNYERQEPVEAMWQDSSGATYKLSGLSVDSFTDVYIPLGNMPCDIDAGHDLIVRGTCDTVIDNSTKQKQSESIRSLKALRIMTCDRNDYGSAALQNYYLTCK